MKQKLRYLSMNFSNCSKQGEFIIIIGVKKWLIGLFLLYNNNNLFSTCLSSNLPASQNVGMERKAGFTIMSAFAFLFSCKNYVTDTTNAILSQKKDPKQNTTNQTVLESLKLYVCSDNLQLVLSPLFISLCLHVLPFTVSGF